MEWLMLFRLLFAAHAMTAADLDNCAALEALKEEPMTRNQFEYLMRSQASYEGSAFEDLTVMYRWKRDGQKHCVELIAAGKDIPAPKFDPPRDGDVVCNSAADSACRGSVQVIVDSRGGGVDVTSKGQGVWYNLNVGAGGSGGMIRSGGAKHVDGINTTIQFEREVTCPNGAVVHFRAGGTATIERTTFSEWTDNQAKSICEAKKPPIIGSGGGGTTLQYIGDKEYPYTWFDYTIKAKKG